VRVEQSLPLRRLADVALQRDEALACVLRRGLAQRGALLGRGGVAGV